MKPLVLCILDGCGIREESDGNAFKNAKKPNIDMLIDKYPHSILEASGRSVGLPDGQMGTSEVGHMNIGTGRIALQPLEAISASINDKSFYKNNKILEVINHVKNNHSNLHIFGLLSDGGVHSHINHLFALLDMCKENNLENIYLDLCLDGRDTEPKSALIYLDMLQNKINELGIGKISTISGRYYAMDRDNNFDRVKLSYDAICYGNAKSYKNYNEIVDLNYSNGITDEFVIPGLIDSCPLNDYDGFIAFDFRKDRLREMLTLLSNPREYELDAKKNNLTIKHYKNLKVLTMYPVTETVLCPHAFDDLDLKNMLADYLYNNGFSQLRIAETEKYPHVTFYFDGGKDFQYNNMKKILIPSSKVATYDVTVINFANGDMVGHTGNYEAAIKAVEHMDVCIGKIYDKVMELNGVLMIIADHGNCDIMWDKNHVPVTSHTTNPVPCIITMENITMKNGKLADVAPTMLKILGLDIPSEMTGNVLIDYKN